jgi:hypothetical protein
MALVPFSGEGTMLAPIINPVEMVEAHERLREWVAAALKPKRDFDILPGTEKYVILKPGVDKLLAGFQLKASFQILSEEVDHDRLNTYDAGKWVTLEDPGRNEKDRLKASFPGRYRSKKTDRGWQWQEKIEEEGKSIGLYRYQVLCKLTDRIGEVVSEAIGICSSLEAKYIRSPRDAEHTILMMAMKRARTAAVTSLLGLSEIFEADDEAVAEPRHERPAPAEREDSTDSTTQPVQIRGMAVILRDWGITTEAKKEIEVLCLENNLKLADALTEAQRSQGSSVVDSPEAFRAWLNGLKEVQG